MHTTLSQIFAPFVTSQLMMLIIPTVPIILTDSQNKMGIPVGPIFIGDSSGHREIWVASPDTEEIRVNLLAFLKKIVEQPTPEYPIGVYADEMVVWQLGEFREGRAIDDLKRIAEFDPDAISPDVFARTRHKTVALAQKALNKILGTE